jgi:hypothetical protein
MMGVWRYTAIDGLLKIIRCASKYALHRVQQGRRRRENPILQVFLSITGPYEEYLAATAALTRG